MREMKKKMLDEEVQKINFQNIIKNKEGEPLTIKNDQGELLINLVINLVVVFICSGIGGFTVISVIHCFMFGFRFR